MGHEETASGKPQVKHLTQKISSRPQANRSRATQTLGEGEKERSSIGNLGVTQQLTQH